MRLSVVKKDINRKSLIKVRQLENGTVRRAAPCILLALVGLWPAAAQTPTTYVGNFSKVWTGGSAITSQIRWAQPFVTGDAPGGYSLHSIDVRFYGGEIFSNSVYKATLWSASDEGAPNSSLETLTNPSSLNLNGTNTFTAPEDVVLAASTRYFVAIQYETSFGDLKWQRANAGLDSGSAAGWTIPTPVYKGAPSETSWVVLEGARFAIKVKGSSALPTPTLTLTPDSISESGGTSTVTASLDKTSDADTTVTVSATPVSPAASGDYTVSANKTLTIPAGETDSTGMVTIVAVDNADDEPNKEVTVSATATNDQGITGDPDDVTLTIEDDEGPPTATLSLDPPSISENGGVSTVTASLDRASSANTTLRVRARPVSPATSGDYTVSANRNLTIAAGATTST